VPDVSYVALTLAEHNPVDKGFRCYVPVSQLNPLTSTLQLARCRSEEAKMTDHPPAPAPRPRNRQHNGQSGGGGFPLDDLSKEIIEQLQQDGRRSYAAIGKAVGLSEAAVRQRVQRLLETGVMQIVGVTDPLMLGFSRQAMIAIKCEGDLEAVADHLAAMEEIDYVVITAGSFDILVELVCESDDQMLEMLNRIRSVPTVTSTESFVYLKLRKQTYTWGTR
jgi:Lrp/AsnC family transcriptional regulator, regulator for asnA, asnC and gidA